MLKYCNISIWQNTISSQLYVEHGRVSHPYLIHNCPPQQYLITVSPEGDLMSILHPLVYMYLPRNREWINQQSFQCTSTYYNHPAIVQTLQSSNIGSKIKMMTPYIMELTSRFFSSLITLLPLQLSHWSFSEGRLKKITWQSERIYCTRTYCTRTLQTHT